MPARTSRRGPPRARYDGRPCWTALGAANAQARLWRAIAGKIAVVIETESMFTLATISGILLATAAVIRSFRSIENQALLAVRSGRALWNELFKKICFS
jgi:hypothetical protein